MRTHVVQLAVTMGDESSSRHFFVLSFCLCEPAISGNQDRDSIIVSFVAPLQALE